MVRVADSLKQQNDLTTFPIAYAEDLWIDKNKSQSETKDYASIQSLFDSGELGGESLPEPEAKDKLLMTAVSRTRAEDLEWIQVDKSEVGDIIHEYTLDEWEALSEDEKPSVGSKVIIKDDSEKSIIDDESISSSKVWSSRKVSDSLVDKVDRASYIPNGADLNDYKTEGKYLIENVDLINAIPDYDKTSNWGYIDVVTLESGYISQSFCDFRGMTRRSFTRRCYNGNWSNWVYGDFYDLNMEFIVGRWIDGKPIYRKVVQINTPSQADKTTEVATLGVSISQIVKIDGYIQIGSASSVGFVPVNGAIINSTTFKGTWVSNNSIYMSVNDYYTNRNATIILEYTKTTD